MVWLLYILEHSRKHNCLYDFFISISLVTQVYLFYFYFFAQRKNIRIYLKKKYINYNNCIFNVLLYVYYFFAKEITFVIKKNQTNKHVVHIVQDIKHKRTKN